MCPNIVSKASPALEKAWQTWNGIGGNCFIFPLSLFLPAACLGAAKGGGRVFCERRRIAFHVEATNPTPARNTVKAKNCTFFVVVLYGYLVLVSLLDALVFRVAHEGAHSVGMDSPVYLCLFARHGCVAAVGQACPDVR